MVHYLKAGNDPFLALFAAIAASVDNPMSGLKLYLFGPPRLERDGESIKIRGRKVLALAAYLAATHKPHSRDTLAALLWPDFDPAGAKANLRRELSRLNKILDEGQLDVDRENVALSPDAFLWLDVEQFQQRLTASQTHNHPASEVCPDCLLLLTEAVTLYGNDFLAGFTLPDAPTFDEWQFFQAEGLRRQLASALERLVKGHTANGSFAEALLHARRWLSLDPLHEPAHQQLMRLYAWAGQQAAALRQYEECVRILKSELGTPPSDETTALFEVIKAKRLAAPAKAEEKLSPLPPRTPAPLPLVPAIPLKIESTTESRQPIFVARERELAQLNSFLDTALAGEGQVVFVTGDAGSGKTTLLAEFARRAQETHSNLIVASGYCNAYAGFGDPYLPFRDVLEMLSGDVQPRQCCDVVTPGHARRLQTLLPQTVQAIVEDGPDLLDICVSSTALLDRAQAFAPGQSDWRRSLQNLAQRGQTALTNLEPHYLFEQYSRVLHRLAADQPLLITLDDLQWADATSIGLLFHLGRRLAAGRILIIGAYRPDEMALGRDSQRHPLEKVLAEFKRTFGDIQIDLAGLEDNEGRSFVDAYLDAQPNRLGECFRQTLAQHTGGHALFTVELLRAMQERGALTQDTEGRWVESEALDWQTLPARIEGVIEERIGRLAPEQRELLAVASVEGVEFTAQVVARIQQMNERQVLRTLSQEFAARHQLVREQETMTPGQPGLAHYRFTHFLFQRYLYNTLSVGERQLLHHEVAQVLETIYSGQIDGVAVQLAHHYLESGEQEKAIKHLLAAGDQARRSVALDEAARYYRAALEHWPENRQAEQAETLHKLGETLLVLGQLQEALDALKASCHLFETLGNRLRAGAAQRLMGRVYWEQADRETSWQYYQQALTILEQEPESVELAHALSSIAQMHMLASEYDQAITWGERALALARRLGAEEVIATVLNNIGCAYSALGDQERGIAMLQESRRCASVLGLPHDEARAYYNLADILMYMGRYAEARRIFEQLETFATRIHASLFRSGVRILLVELDWQVGQWANALNRRSRLEAEESDFIYQGRSQMFTSRLLGRMASDLGRPDVARQELEKGLPIARRFQELQTIAPLLGELIRVYSLLKLTSQTQEVIQELCDRLDRATHYDHGVSPALLFAICWLAAQKNEQAIEEAQTCVRRLERVERQIGNILTELALSEGRAIVAAAAGDSDGAIDHFQGAVAGWASLGRPYDHMRALKGLGEALAKKGDEQNARRAFEQALTIVEKLAAQLEEAALKESFLNSRLVREIRAGLEINIGP